jgi:hypothetical protein
MALIEDQFEDTLLIVRRLGPAALVLALGSQHELPRIRTAGHHPADVGPTRMAVRDQLGLDTVVLGCQRAVVTDGVVRRLLALESLDAPSAGPALNWVSTEEFRDQICPELLHGVVLDHWFRVSPGQPGPPDGRGWTVPGWWAHATAWITQRVQDAGLGRVLAIDQVRAWEFSCVLRVPH